MKKQRFLEMQTVTRALLLILALLAGPAGAQTDTFSTPGTTSWTAPAGVTSATVEAWGGGGAGGGARGRPAEGGGGAGGQYASSVVTVVPGNTYPIVVGAGGTGSTGDGTAGGDSTFNGTTVVAKGGAGGAGAPNNYSAGAAGSGTASNGLGATVYAGGSGSSGVVTGGGCQAGGAGGGGAGSGGAGGNAAGNTGGTGTVAGGGAGGAGRNSSGNGSTGSVAGGGGGAACAETNTDRSGGDGAAGQVSITYVPSAAVVSINTAGANPTNTATVSWTVTFSTSVTGVNDTAFTLAPSGLSGTFITTVTGSGTTWTVTANTGIGSGTLGLNQTGPGSVSPALTGMFTGQVYAVSATPALAEYRMDETLWNGTAGEVVDNSGNGNNAQAFNSASTVGTTPAIAGSPGTCNYGVLDNGGTITAGYVQTPLPNLTTDFTITGWIRTTNNTVSGQRILIDDQNNTGGYGFSLGDGAAGRLRFYSRGITPIILDSTYTIANNTWYFVAAVADIANKMRTIYVFNAAGTLLASTTEAAWTGGAWGTDTGPVSIGGEVNGPPQSETPATFHFHGNLDEVRVYPKVLSQAAVAVIATQTHACPMTSSVNHFLVDPGAATASTCTPENVTITVLNAVNNVVTNYTGTVNITTSPAHGDWSTVTAAGPLTPGASDSGMASYTFAAADNGVATLALSDQHADAALSVSVVDPLVATSSTTSTAIAFSDNAFVITNDAVQVAGRPQAMSAAMWRKEPSTGTCSVSPYYTGAKNLKAWLTLDVSDPGGAAPKIGAVSLPGSTPGANNVALTFGAGSANFNLSTSDVGKYVLNLSDDSLSFASAAINGSSNTITTRPFALVVSAIKQGGTPNPASSTSGGAVFAKAGTAFQATVGAYLWNSAADTDSNGIPDAGATLAQITANGGAPSYTWPTTVSGNAPYTPAGGTLSPLSSVQTGTCPAAVPNCFANGIATPTNLSYAEVGSLTLGVAAANNFLNTSGVDLNAANGTALVFDNTGARNGVVGRFIPDHFDTVVTSQGGGFAYSGNPVGPVPGQPFTVTVTAMNGLATPAPTANYYYINPGDFAKAVNLSVPVGGTTGKLYVDAVAGGTGAIPASKFANVVPGQATVNYSDATGKISFVFDSLPYYLAAPIQIHAEDADTVTSSGANGSINILQGRLRLFNAFGSEQANLIMPLQAQYWTGNSWVLNSADSVTVIPAASVALWDYTGTLNAMNLGPSHVSTGTTPTLSGGLGSIVLTMPFPTSPTATGSVDLAVNLGTGIADQSCFTTHPATTGAAIPWLRSIYGDCAATYNSDPSARGSFGIYAPETRKTIHLRELF